MLLETVLFTYISSSGSQHIYSINNFWNNDSLVLLLLDYFVSFSNVNYIVLPTCIPSWSFLYHALSWYSSHCNHSFDLCNCFSIPFKSTSVLPQKCDLRCYTGHPSGVIPLLLNSPIQITSTTITNTIVIASLLYIQLPLRHLLLGIPEVVVVGSL